MEPQKPNDPKNLRAKPAAGASTPPPAVPKLPPLFRKIDWLTMLLAFGVVWIVYFLTLAPEVTLQDSGELCTGAYYAGIPHPPGYPFWSIYSWFWCHFLPIGNIAWRVEVGESTAAALACGLVALMVSRGSSMLIEGIEDLKNIPRTTETAICIVCGAVAGISLGLGQVMWSESVAINRISLFGVPWVMMVLLCLFRWIYAPQQLRYLFCAMFLFGICLTVHQTLLCAGLGIEAVIATARPRLGRTFFMGNFIIYLAAQIAEITKLTTALDMAFILQFIFHAVGVASLTCYFWFAVTTKQNFREFCRDGAALVGLLLLVVAASQGAFFAVLGLASLGVFVWLLVDTHKLGLEWLVVIGCGLLVCVGAAFYLYEPISSMTNPPMNWCYPRTREGFIAALTRGQYEGAHPSDFIHDPLHFLMQLGILLTGIAEEYNWFMLCVALVPLFFFFKLKKRERAWLVGLVGTYLCIGVLLVILMNPGDDKSSMDLHKVFFTSSHGIIAILIGCGLALITAFMATQYRRFRIQGLMLGAVAVLPALMAVYGGISSAAYGGVGALQPGPCFVVFLFLAAALILAGIAAQKLPPAPVPDDKAAPVADSSSFRLFGALSLVCLLFAGLLAFFNGPENALANPNLRTFLNDESLSPKQVLTGLGSGLTPKIANLPVFASLLIFSIVAAFVAAVAACKNRAPLTLMLGLFCLLPLSSAMSHWAGSEQRNHWFGYWFGHDMFTPPFTGPDGKLTYDPKLREQAMQGPNGRLVYPEMTRDAILFGGTDPGRFCPTYMAFCESFTAHDQQPVQDQKFDRRDVYVITQNALADANYLNYIRAHYNRSTQIDPPFFQEMLRSEEERSQHYTTNTVARLAYRWLDEPFTAFGAKVEERRRKEGIYPPKEIYTPNEKDSRRCFDEYMTEVQQRYYNKQLKPGENVVTTPDGRVSVNGQVSVMAINGLLTKVIFDHNPTNEFFVEESFPLDWMFPYLSPFGVIMKINRQPVTEMTDEIIQRDHAFWSHYSDRLIGNWITADTSVKEIVDFVDQRYVRHDLSGFQGNRQFMRDEEAQKSFSKLRSAIGGIYAWRLGMLGGVPPMQYMAQGPERARLLKETDFAFRQSFAFCPFSPEAVSRYIAYLASDEVRRYDDALLVAGVAYKLDPNNSYFKSLVTQLTDLLKRAGSAAQIQASLGVLEKQAQDNPTNFQAAFNLASAYLQLRQTARATQVIDSVLTNTNADASVIRFVVDYYNKTTNFTKLFPALKRLTEVDPHAPDGWYNLAKFQAYTSQPQDAINSLRHAVEENAAALAKDPKAPNIQESARTEPVFASLRALPEFQQLVAPK